VLKIEVSQKVIKEPTSTMVFFYNFVKRIDMTVADLKLKIFREVDSLEKNRLQEIYGILINYIRSQKDIDDWDKLTEIQQQGIIDAIKEIDDGKGLSHKSVIDRMRRKCSNA